MTNNRDNYTIDTIDSGYQFGFNIDDEDYAQYSDDNETQTNAMVKKNEIMVKIWK